MPIEKINIDRFLELAKHHPVIDVRSPGEYGHAHIPGAINLPLFTDEERKIVGTAYKQQSREEAIKIGLDFFGAKMRSMVQAAEGISNLEFGIRSSVSQFQIPNPKSLLLYCWRGGMRSAGVAWLMDLYGFKVYTLVGGYKKYRTLVLESFKQSYRFNIIGGYTGSGKTELLKALKEKGERTIDLEDIAKHKGSAFGSIGLPKQPTQEMFENLLSNELRNISTEMIWLEDESQRIGDINLPHEFWKTMRTSPVFFLDVSFEERLKRLVDEYGGLDKEKMRDSILRIERRLGGLETKNAVNFIEQDNFIECFRILLKYYDKWYFKSLHNRENINSLLTMVPCKNAGAVNLDILLEQTMQS
jgi:tRNA 2-selenouridine synthase